MGKLIGGLLGLFSGGFFYALIGIAVGHLFDRSLKQAMGFNSAEKRELMQQSFFETTFRVMGHIAKADGRICKFEIAQADAIFAQLGLTPERRRFAIERFKEGGSESFQLENAIERFLATCGDQPLMRQMILEALIAMALADDDLDSAEQDVLSTVAQLLGMSGAQFERLLQMAQAQRRFDGRTNSGYQQGHGRDEQSALDAAYQALGVSEDVNNKNLKKAYRKLMSEHHPDKLIAQGMPEDMVRIATEKSQEISAAYELIGKHRGLA